MKSLLALSVGFILAFSASVSPSRSAEESREVQPEAICGYCPEGGGICFGCVCICP